MLETIPVSSCIALRIIYTWGLAGIPVSPQEAAVTTRRLADRLHPAAFAFSPSKSQLRSQLNVWDSPLYSMPLPACCTLQSLVRYPWGVTILLSSRQGRRLAVQQHGWLIPHQLSKNNGKVQCKEQGIEIERAIIVAVIAGLRNANIHSP